MSDWLTFIKSIPGLAKAVTELIGDVSRVGSAAANLGTAKLNQYRQSIDDRTVRESAFSHARTDSEIAIAKAITNASVKHIDTQVEQFAERALVHGVHRLMKEQHNREMVVLKTIENLQSDPPQSPTDETPTEDWLNLFGRYAENASSEKLREHWAHILAGEIKRPGSFSVTTLHLASVLDERLVRKIENIRPWMLFNHAIPVLGPLQKGALYTDLLTLAGIGFLIMGGHADETTIIEHQDETTIIEFQDVLVWVPKPSIFGSTDTVSFPAAMLTQAGKELLSALGPTKESPELPEAIVRYLMQQGFQGITIKEKRE